MLLNNNKILFYHNPIDMRKGINGLTILISNDLSINPGDGSIYVFYNKSYNKLKLIYWDRNGFCLFYKILSKEKFKIPKLLSSQIISMEELRWLLDGLDIKKTQGFKTFFYDSYY